MHHTKVIEKIKKPILCTVTSSPKNRIFFLGTFHEDWVLL